MGEVEGKMMIGQGDNVGTVLGGGNTVENEYERPGRK